MRTNKVYKLVIHKKGFGGSGQYLLVCSGQTSTLLTECTLTDGLICLREQPRQNFDAQAAVAARALKGLFIARSCRLKWLLSEQGELAPRQ